MFTMQQDVMQTLMDRAYDRWQSNNGWSKQEFWDQLDAKERIAVYLGNLTYQVQNGGFAQWWGNRYATQETVGFILRTCVKINTDAANAVRDLVALAWAALDGHCDRGLDEQEWQELSDSLDNLDHAFYLVDDQFLKDVEIYLRRAK